MDSDNEETPKDGPGPPEEPPMTRRQFVEEVVRPQLYLAPSTLQMDEPLSVLSEDVRQKLEGIWPRAAGLPNIEYCWTELFTHAERQKLGGDRGAAIDKWRSPVYMLMVVRPEWYVSALVTVAECLQLFPPGVLAELRREVRAADPVRAAGIGARRHNEGDEDYEQLVRKAVDEFDLVLADGGVCRALWWRRKLVDVDWLKYDKPWAFLRRLVAAGMSSRPVRWDDLGGNENALADWKNRLKEHLPLDIWQKIASIGSGAYQLDLKRDQMRLVELPDDVRLDFLQAAQYEARKAAIRESRLHRPNDVQS